MLQWGGGGVWTRLVVGYTWAWASLGFPTGLVCFVFNNWSMVAGRGRRCKKTKGGNPEAEFPPQNCGPGLPREVRVARGAAQINVNNLGGGLQGCCPGHYVFHCECAGVVCCLIALVMGDWQGLILGEGVGSSIRPGLQGCIVGKVLGT